MSEQENGDAPSTGGWDYSPAPESTDPSRLRARYGLFIGGEWAQPRSGRWFDTINPADRAEARRGRRGRRRRRRRAVAAARGAYEKVWSKLSARERGKYIYRIARMIQERAASSP